MNVAFIAAELRPLAVVGGLGDVIGALPKALAGLGTDVRIILPKYGVIDDEKYPSTVVASGISVPFDGKNETVDVHETPLPDSTVPVYLIRHDAYLGENGIYFQKDASSDGSAREVRRFLFFVRSAVQIFEAIAWWPDVIHFHDWHVGLTPVLVKILAKTDPRYASMKLLLTIHNIAYQGWYKPEDVFQLLGINESDLPSLAERAGEHRNLASLQQGILNADAINTVSPNYAKEILTPDYGERLEETLKKRFTDLTGILNGIDVDHFNPATDRDITVPYGAGSIEKKKENATALRSAFGLPETGYPIIGVVSRLTDQKGIDLIHDALMDILQTEDVQFVLLGTGTEADEQRMQALADAFPEKAKVAIEFNAKTAQQIYAGTDIFLIPSKFEPCGLTQMISMRYGTIPVVRATGGLRDTVTEFDGSSGDGFVFENYDAKELAAAIRRALIVRRDQPDAWTAMMIRDMQRDFSWTASARQYVALYEKLIH